ncbi:MULTISPECIES: lipopolysaccharide biosynthesis protein [Streptomyces]|uniref:Lipopolysaccharide biosynthesis protein n=1 Tax=Streptomyces solicathayae TaxID=3081768 RepID=A0ABZ0LSE5_9ACTN|nr:lipopolysaccharide biosynthesis protein [Streptomyces sp. HUAS YS2]WOX22406.1 lipopolysaccharide biosynthesis protein [Streptomyces sp. HUAS YS2]
MTQQPTPDSDSGSGSPSLIAALRARRRWWALPAAVVLGAVAGGGYGLLKTPEYAATSYVIVVPGEKSDPAAALGFAQAYGRVATDLAVTGDAQVWAGVSAATLRANVQAATSPDAPMISLTARSPRPATAVAMADGVARALVQSGTHASAGTGVKVVQFSRATKPTSPVSPSAPLSALVGGCAGGLLGGLALLVRPRRAPEGGAQTAEVTASVPAPASASAAPATEPV